MKTVLKAWWRGAKKQMGDICSAENLEKNPHDILLIVMTFIAMLVCVFVIVLGISMVVVGIVTVLGGAG